MAIYAMALFDVLIDDLVCLIFRTATDAARDEHHISGTPYISPAWFLACVSRRWRFLALEDPTLWTGIAVDLYREPPHVLPLQSYVSTMLARSSNQRLNVVIRASRRHICFKTLSMLQDVQHRWGQVTISVPTASLLLDICRPVNTHRWCSLRHISLDLAWDYGPFFTLDLRHVTSLRHFTEHTSEVECDILLPLDTLKTFYLFLRHRSHPLASRIEFAPHLQECHIRLSEWADIPAKRITLPRGTFPSLKRLSLANCTPFLPSFEAAKLVVLRIDGNFVSNAQYVPTLVQLLVTSQSTLEELYLEGTGAASWDSALVASITSLSQLHTLTVLTYVASTPSPSLPGHSVPSYCWKQHLLAFLSHFNSLHSSIPCPRLTLFTSQWLIHDTGRASATSEQRAIQEVQSAWRDAWRGRLYSLHCSMVVQIRHRRHILSWPSPQ